MGRSVISRFGLATWVAAALVFPAVVAAQPPDGQPTFRSGVDVIEIDVNVVDRGGMPITDLDPSDFGVRIDGEDRRVVQAQYVSLRPEAQPAAAAEPQSRDRLYTSNAEQQRGRLIVIAVDEENILTGEGRHLMRAAGEFVDALSPSDQVALLSVPQPGIYIDFTTDHERVSRETARMAGLGERSRRSLNIGLSEAFRIAVYGDRDLEEDVIGRVCGESPACAFQVRNESMQIVQEVKFHATNARRGIEGILRALGDIEGPKHVVWVSGGLVIDQNAVLLREIEDLAAASRTTLFVMMVDEPLTDMSEALPAPTPRQDRYMRERGLSAAAAVARGELFRVTANPRRIFERLEAQIAGYYLLGVEVGPEDRNEDRRRIRVSVARDGAQVRARREVRFVEEPEEEQSVDQRLLAMLRSPVATTELPLRVATYSYPDPEDGLVRVSVAADVGSDLNYASDVTLGFALRDPDGRVVSTGRRRVTATPAERPGGVGYEYTLPMTVPRGRYSLRVAAIDGFGRRGSVDHLLLAGQASDAPLAFGPLQVADQRPSPDNLLAVVEPEVTSGRVIASMEVYAESSWAFDRTSVHVDVAGDETGPARAYATAALLGTNDTPWRSAAADLAVGHLPPGQYVARVRVLRDSDEVARMHRPFRITAVPRQVP
ncbi:MAG: VWA domain-containing protein [Acidimicrobiia bacterium]|nr:VWA domain-containing protein [Acidimicrobiia bacterium]